MTDDDKPESNLHPMEEALGIEAGSTLQALAAENAEKEKPLLPTIIDLKTGAVVPRKLDASEADLELEERQEDLKVDGQLDVIHKKAIDAFDSQHRLSQEVDPKFSARNAEVAAQYLNIALNSVNSRVDSKYKRSKIRIARGNIGTPGSVQTNVIVADRNDVLKALFKGEMKVINEDKQ